MGDNNLITFLRARLNEDAETARHARDLSEAATRGAYAMVMTAGDVAHVARNNPARVLREVAAKRRIVDAYAEVASNDVDEPYEYAYGWANGLGLAVRLLAATYADHPDYRPEWRP